MESDQYISSKQNPRVKGLIRLRDKKERDETGYFLIEGYRENRRAIDAGEGLVTLYVSPGHFLGENEGALIADAKKQGTEIVELEKEVFSKVSYRDRPDGLLGVGVQKNRTAADLNTLIQNTTNPIFIVAEAIEKPGNLGSLLRSADGAGVDGVIVCDRCTDIYNPNVIRASVGTFFSTPTFQLSNQEVLDLFSANQIQMVATTPHTNLLYTDADLTGPIAIVVGTEQLGLSDEWLNRANIQVRIPMCGIADSLNVASATTLVVYEALRQRS
ncbi:MAG: 23S rRNA (uridine(2479)-2'-O)-methyltransferase [Chlamydiia bacterium]|nr:23S rRNA (uridine(2479)-2'-O)-methyltransferase [Chlamydiia bacterium]